MAIIQFSFATLVDFSYSRPPYDTKLGHPKIKTIGSKSILEEEFNGKNMVFLSRLNMVG